MGSNIETRTKITDNQSVNGLSAFVDRLINDEEKYYIEINRLGSMMFYGSIGNVVEEDKSFFL